jgi:hypothetical protein
MHSGDYRAALAHVETAASLYRPDEHRDSAFRLSCSVRTCGDAERDAKPAKQPRRAKVTTAPQKTSRSKYGIDAAAIAAGRLPDKAPVVTSATSCLRRGEDANSEHNEEPVPPIRDRAPERARLAAGRGTDGAIEFALRKGASVTGASAATQWIIVGLAVLGLGQGLRRLVDDGSKSGDAATLDRAVIVLLGVVVASA